MASIFKYEEHAKDIFNKILGNPELCERFTDEFYNQLEGMNILGEITPDKFSQAVFRAYENKDLTAFLMIISGNSMFDLLRNACLIPIKYEENNKNPILLTNKEGIINNNNIKINENIFEHFKKIFLSHNGINKCNVYLANGYHIRHKYNENMNVEIDKYKETTGVLLVYAMPNTKEYNMSEVQGYNLVLDAFMSIQKRIPSSLIFYGQDDFIEDNKKYDKLAVLIPLHKFEVHLKEHIEYVDKVVSKSRSEINSYLKKIS